MENNKANSAREMKVLIDKVMIPGYSYKTNFSCSDYLVDINYKMVIKARLIKKDNKMVYEFVLDTQFINNQEITHDELKMSSNIIEILENNRKFVLSRLKKYTVQEYEQEQIEAKRRSDLMLEALKTMIMREYGVHVADIPSEIISIINDL